MPDSGFASPELYKACEENDCKYAIRLKQNSTLIKYASDADEDALGAFRQEENQNFEVRITPKSM